METEIDDPLMTSISVRANLGGVSDMFLHRRRQDDPDFPAPIYIAGRRYWRRSEIEAYKRKKAAQSPRSAPRPCVGATKEPANAT